MNRWMTLSLFVLMISPMIAFTTSISATDGDATGIAADDWITINKDYASQRYVDLDQITPRNVGKLKEICEIQLNEPTFFSSGLLKIGRTLYVNTYNTTTAFDATTCKLRWRKGIVAVRAVSTNNSRGSAYLDGKIFRGTPDGTLIALDANTGQLLWHTKDSVADPKKHEAFVSAPVAWQGKVFAGIAVGDSGIAGRLMAFDAKSGDKLWAFDTTLGFNAGGGFWTTYSLDPTTGEVFGSVANPFPDFFRDGEVDREVTRYTDSVISVDAARGRLNWSYQAVPRDEHDWDLGTAPTLYRTPTGRAMVAVTGKSGRVYGIDRTTRMPVFNTPATTLENDQKPLTRNWMHVCPGLQGGAQFNGTAYNPRAGMLFVGMGDHCAWYFTNPTAPDATNGGGVAKDWAAAAKLQAPRGWITAINGTTGAVRWTFQTQSQVQAGLVPTKSGLLFAGDTHGNLRVFDAMNGNLLKSIDAGGAINNGLISYSVDGEQYVAAGVGGATENPSTVAGPLRVSIYGLRGGGKPNVVILDRLPLNAGSAAPGLVLYFQNCSQCHGITGAGSSAPPVQRQSQLADPKLLKQFLASVRPPMPRLFPGVLMDKDVEQIAGYLRTNVFFCGTPKQPQSCEPAGKPSSGGTAAWRAIYTDLTSPRCINCHPRVSSKLPHFYGYPQDYPRQGDDRHPHYYGVLRGDESLTATGSPDKSKPGIGTPFARCTSCHGTKNNPLTGIPGSFDPQHPGIPFWELAPAEVAWESSPGVPFTGPQLCAQLKDPRRNGNRTVLDLLSHIENDNFVNWAFAPGIRPNGELRTSPPISHPGLVEAFKIWIAEGAPCPAGKK
jgi:alcohol dehydrogenase (cytochrome c)